MADEENPTPQNQKVLKQLLQAVETAYASPGKMFWRGLLWGLGRGIGNLIGWLLLLAILVYLFQISGLANTFKSLTETVNNLSNTVTHIPGQ